MAGGEPLNGKVALRLFLLIVGTLFIWEAVPSTRWTYDLSPNMQTGLWKSCSCNMVKRNPDNCNVEYSYLQGSYFYEKYGCDENRTNCRGGTDFDREWKNNKQFQHLFRKRIGGNQSFELDPKNHHKEHGAPQWTQEEWDTILTKERVYEADKDQCERYLATGPIALISYIFAFIAFLLVIRNIAANKVPVMDAGVHICVIMTGIWGLITTVIFGELFARSEGHAPLGHQFAVFTIAWILFFVVGITGLSDSRKNVTVSENTSAIRSALFVAALVGFAYSMGNDWSVVDNQYLIAPLGGFQWTIKGNSFFIAPAEHAGYINDDALLRLHNRDDERKAVYCNETVKLRNPEADLSHLTGDKNAETVQGDFLKRRLRDAPRSVTGRQENANNTRNHYPNQCLLPARPTIVRGHEAVGLWKRCYCKETTSLSCTMFGSYWPMFNGRDQKCNTFNVARAMILMVGVMSFLALVLSSVLIGGLRRVNLHLVSNNLCMLVFLLGLISSILYGAVIYPVGRLSADFALYLAGWWLVFFAGIVGIPITSYYGDVENAGKIIPLNPLA